MYRVTWAFNLDDMMGVHLKVREEAEKKKSETIASGEEYIQLTDEMITSSVMQVYLVSISSTFYVRIFRTNVVFLVTFWLC